MRPALANNDSFVVWDHNIASAVSAGLQDEDRCEERVPSFCTEQAPIGSFNLSFDRPITYFTFLDSAAAIPCYKYHKVNYNQKLWDQHKLRVGGFDLQRHV